MESGKFGFGPRLGCVTLEKCFTFLPLSFNSPNKMGLVIPASRLGALNEVSCAKCPVQCLDILNAQ